MKSNRIIIPFIGLSLTLALFSCNMGSKDAKQAEEEDSTKMEITADKSADELKENSSASSYENGELLVYPAKIAKEFPNAELEMTSPKFEEVKNVGEYEFNFSVANYSLAEQTPMAEMRDCANSKKGQHIHYILNNSPYEAHYEPTFKGELMEGNNVVLAFLSRSYHESIKNGSAFVLKNFQIGEVVDQFDATAEHLFYSRPKGTYEGEDTKKILLDFYLVNSKLASDGNKVKVNIDEHEFMLDSWEPYFVEGLSKGKHSFRIRLVDNDGTLVAGPFNDSGSREIELK